MNGWLLGILVLAVGADSFQLGSGPPTRQQYPTRTRLDLSSNGGSERPRNSQGTNARTFTTHVIASDALILPGEGMTVFLTHQEALPLLRDSLLKDGLVDHETGGNMGSVVAAVRLMSEEGLPHLDQVGEQPQPHPSLSPVASLCEITGLHAGKPGEYVQVDLQCTGQVRLLEMTWQYNANHFQFIGEYVDSDIEDEMDFEEARILETNIEVLMKTVSHMEQEIQLEVVEQQRRAEANSDFPPSLFPMTCCLYDQYEAAKANVEKLLSKASQGQQDATEDMLRLTATSWGVFMCLNDPSLEARYRLRALDWDDLLERIKLAQYALREKQLRLQGRLMELQEAPAMSSEVIDKYFLDDRDSFQ